MAGAREIGIGIARALSLKSGPNPLPLSFRGQSIIEAAEIVRAVLRECEDAGIKLSAVELEPDLYHQFRGHVGTSFNLVENSALSGEAQFFKVGSHA